MTIEPKDPVFRAITRANPEEEGSIMRELKREHPDLPEYIEDLTHTFVQNPRRRSKYVSGWRPK